MCSIWTSALADNRNVTIDHCYSICLIREQEISRNFNNNASINRLVISVAILKYLQLIDTCYGKDSRYQPICLEENLKNYN